MTISTVGVAGSRAGIILTVAVGDGLGHAVAFPVMRGDLAVDFALFGDQSNPDIAHAFG